MRYLIAAALMTLAGSALAVAPANWTHSSEADFTGGEFKSTVLSSTGELALSRQVSTLMPSSAELTTVSAVATDGKAVYAGSGTSGMVYRIEGGKSSKWATVPGTIVTSLVWTGKELLAGSGGDGAGLYAIDSAGKVARRWSDANVKYVWAILPVGDDKIYLGTGPEAAIYAISVNGKSAAVVFKDGKWAKNVLCLAASKDGMIYAGTDENGLVFEINPVKNESRVILDAEEKEISSIVVDTTGGVFAATCDADKAEGGEEGEGAAAERITATRARPAPASRPSMRSGGPERGKDESTPPEPVGRRPDAKTTTTNPAAPLKSATPRSFSDGATTTAPARPAATQPRPPSPAAMAARARAAMAARARGPQPAPVSELTGPGNAVYYIAPDGLVRCIFRKPVTILSMIELGGKLILGTGNGGTIYVVTREGRQYVQLVNTDAKQVTSLIAGGDGRIIFATANKGSVAMIGGELAKEGTYTSKALDAQQISKWGTARLRTAAPVGTAVTFSTRSGNIGEVDDKTWSAWSKPAQVGDGFIQITSPAARFLQYRIAFTSSGSTGSPPRAESRGGKAAPSVNLVDILYQTGNLPPTVQDIAVKSSTTGRENEGPDATGPQYFRAINITATDNNNDQLVYKIEFRAIGSMQWIELADKQESAHVRLGHADRRRRDV